MDSRCALSHNINKLNNAMNQEDQLEARPGAAYPMPAVLTLEALHANVASSPIKVGEKPS